MDQDCLDKEPSQLTRSILSSDYVLTLSKQAERNKIEKSRKAYEEALKGLDLQQTKIYLQMHPNAISNGRLIPSPMGDTLVR